MDHGVYAYDLRHKFGQSPTIEKFNPPAIFSQLFKHWAFVFCSTAGELPHEG